jgi:hypothetical protein
MKPLTFDIGIHVFVTRTQKVPKIYSSITACFTHAEQNKIILDASLRATTSKHASERREGFNSMLRRVVVPWNVIVLQESKKFLAIFLKSFFIADSDFRLKIGPCQPTVELANLPFVFFHETTLESIPINGFNDRLNQRRETVGH